MKFLQNNFCLCAKENRPDEKPPYTKRFLIFTS